MKILHVIKDLHIAGGAERIVCDLINEGDFHYLVYYGKKADIFFKTDEKKVFYKQGIIKLILFLICNYRKFSFFHLHLFPSIYLTSFFPDKCIIHEHNTHNRRRDILLLRPIEKIIYKKALFTLAISDSVKKSLHKWLSLKVNVRVLSNYMPIPLVSNKLKFDLEEKQNQINLIMVASFTKQKRHDFLLEIFKYLPDNFFLYLIGSGPLLSQIKDKAKKLLLSERILFVGKTLYVGDFYKISKLNILLSNWEGFGLTPLEAAYFGVPSLVSSVDGLIENSFDERFLVNSENPKFVAIQIQNLIKIVEEPEIKKNLKQLIIRNSFENYQSKLKSIYESYV